MATSFNLEDQRKLTNTLMIPIEDPVTEMRVGKTGSYILSLDSSIENDIGLDSLRDIP